MITVRVFFRASVFSPLHFTLPLEELEQKVACVHPQRLRLRSVPGTGAIFIKHLCSDLRRNLRRFLRFAIYKQGLLRYLLWRLLRCFLQFVLPHCRRIPEHATTDLPFAIYKAGFAPLQLG